MTKKEKQRFKLLRSEIIKHFEWDRVGIVMEALDWGWRKKGQTGTWSGELERPSIKRMKKFCKAALKDAYISKLPQNCGGFLADYQDGILSLKFVVDSWESDSETIIKTKQK